MKKHVSVILFFSFLTALMFALYAPALDAPFVYDDRGKILNNPDIRTFPNLSRLVYRYSGPYRFERNDPSRPVVYFTYALNYLFGKLNPFGYRIFNIVFHLLNSYLIFLLALKLYSILLGKFSRLLPFMAAGIFALHPVNAYTVTYIFSRSNILCTLFYLLGILAFISYRQNKNSNMYFAVVVCYLLSLFSKQIGITLPAVLVMVDYVFLCNSKYAEFKKNIKPHVPLVSMVFLYLLFRYSFFGAIGDVDAKSLINGHYYTAMQPYVFIQYLKLLFVPVKTSFLHLIQYIDLFDVRVISSYIVLTAMVIALIKYAAVSSSGARIFVFSFVFFIITLSPTSSIFPTTILMQENRIYLPSIAFIMFVLYHFHRVRKYLFPILIIAYIPFLCVMTYRRNLLFAEPVSLYSDIIHKYPVATSVGVGHHLAYNNRGFCYSEKGEDDKAIRDYNTSVKLNPGYALSKYNRGNTYMQAGNYELAIRDYKDVINIEPDYIAAYINLGGIYNEIGEYETAIQYLNKAIKINPYHTAVLNNRGNAYKNLNMHDLAAKDFDLVLKVDPNFDAVYNSRKNLYASKKNRDVDYINAQGNACINRGEYDAALKHYKEAIKLNPDYVNAYINLGGVYNIKGEYEQSINFLSKAISLSPNNEAAYNNRGNAYLQSAKYDLALKDYTKAIQLNPDYVFAYNSRGDLYLKTGDRDKAVSDYKKAVDLGSKYAAEKLKGL